MDMICLHLDRSASPGVRVPALITQRWEYLADEFEVLEDIKRRCENYCRNLSPSEAMFEYLRMTRSSLKIETIKEYLRSKELGRKDVIEELEKNKDLSGEWIAGCNKETLTIKVLFFSSS